MSPGVCLISDNVIMAFEAMPSLCRKTGGEVRFVALKLDMSKTYDRMKWSFDYEEFGFS